VCITSATFSRISAVPTVNPEDPAMKKQLVSAFSELSHLNVGLISGKQDVTPCKEE
jgi:hypothetical protein